ncbi:MAG: glycoside hydrolase family 10 protein [Planctomycetota bacterium]|jgi:uncharacterized lipoprotein YddW (UPF0748 family)
MRNLHAFVVGALVLGSTACHVFPVPAPVTPKERTSTTPDQIRALVATPETPATALPLALPVATPAAAPEAPAEVRAIWVTRWDYKTADDVRRAIARVKKMGANTVLFQVRGQADAFYRSALEPWAQELGGTDPGFDPLQVACETAKQLGVSLHAYMNVMPVWKGAKAPRAANHIWNAHPEWIVVHKSGRRQQLNDHYVVLNPAHPSARKHLVNVFADVATRYPVDGIHLDYVRYLSLDYSWDPTSLRRFALATGKRPGDDGAAWDQWRRDQVTETVRDIVAACKAARPGVIMSAAVWRTPQSGHDRFLQDVPRWYRQGLLDWSFPMIYTRDAVTFRRQLAANLASHTRTRILPGIGSYMHVQDPAQTARQVEASRNAGAGGFGLFAYGSFFSTADSDGGYAKQDATELDRLRHARLAALEQGPFQSTERVSR